MDNILLNSIIDLCFFELTFDDQLTSDQIAYFLDSPIGRHCRSEMRIILSKEILKIEKLIRKEFEDYQKLIGEENGKN